MRISAKYPRNSRPRKTSTRNPGHVHHHRRGRLRRQLSEAHRHPSPTVLSHQRDWPGRDVGAEQCRGAGTARSRDLRCVAAVARQARMLRSPKLQCESGRTARGSSRPRLRAPASGGHPSQSSTGQDNGALRFLMMIECGDCRSASTRPNSTGSTNNSGGSIESHNVGWSITVLSTMASVPSRQGVEAIFSPKHSHLRTATPRLFQVEVASTAGA